MREGEQKKKRRSERSGSVTPHSVISFDVWHFDSSLLVRFWFFLPHPPHPGDVHLLVFCVGYAMDLIHICRGLHCVYFAGTYHYFGGIGRCAAYCIFYWCMSLILHCHLVCGSFNIFFRDRWSAYPVARYTDVRGTPTSLNGLCFQGWKVLSRISTLPQQWWTTGHGVATVARLALCNTWVAYLCPYFMCAMDSAFPFLVLVVFWVQLLYYVLSMLSPGSYSTQSYYFMASYLRLIMGRYFHCLLCVFVVSRYISIHCLLMPMNVWSGRITRWYLQAFFRWSTWDGSKFIHGCFDVWICREGGITIWYVIDMHFEKCGCTTGAWRTQNEWLRDLSHGPSKSAHSIQFHFMSAVDPMFLWDIILYINIYDMTCFASAAAPCVCVCVGKQCWRERWCTRLVLRMTSWFLEMKAGYQTCSHIRWWEGALGACLNFWKECMLLKQTMSP